LRSGAADIINQLLIIAGDGGSRSASRRERPYAASAACCPIRFRKTRCAWCRSLARSSY
jgi:hypothetical protein